MTAGVLALTLALLPSAARAQDQVDDLRKDLARLQKQLDDMQKERDLERKISATRWKILEARLQQLEDDLKQLKRRQFSFDPQTETGSVVIRNDLEVPATVTINGTAYVIGARSRKTLSGMPVGSIRYTVTADGFGVGPARNSTVSATDPLSIRIYDPR